MIPMAHLFEIVHIEHSAAWRAAHVSIHVPGHCNVEKPVQQQACFSGCRMDSSFTHDSVTAHTTYTQYTQEAYEDLM